MRKALPSLAAVCLFALLASGCADRKDPNQPEDVHPDTWMQASSEDFHGEKVQLTGLVSCPACHGEDFRGGESDVSCYKCHNGPGGHPQGWLDTTATNFHGTAIIEQEGVDYCAGCHGEDFRGMDNSGGSCYECHNGPSGHPEEGWIDVQSAGFHGLAASIRGLGECAECHGSDFEGGWSGQTCKSCHASESGHPADGWLTQGTEQFHGARWVETGSGYCAGCHGVDLRGGYSGVSCYTCHDGPSGHPSEGWLSAESENFHGLDASSRGLDACATCHGAGFQGGISGQSCSQCHPSESGHPATGWMDQQSDKFHGERWITFQSEYCAGCHGEDFRGGDAGVSCYTCHNGPSGHPADGWLSAASDNFHGLDASSRGLDACARCHGADFQGGLSGVSCSQCHADESGHPSSGWIARADGFHGERLAETGLEYCGGCHGEDFRGGDSGASCYTCHNGPSGHPASGWLLSTSDNFHGLAASSRGLTACAACHGDDYTGGLSGVSCSQCHADESGHPSTGWLTPSSTSFHGVRVSQTGTAYCGGCHGEDFRGGDSGVSCYTCHNGPSGHPEGWFVSTSPNYHGTVIEQEGVETCYPCHGDDLAGGVSGVACSDCH